MSPTVYDAGVLIAAERSKRWAWSEHRRRLEMGMVALVPSPVVAQVSRSAQQAQLRRFLRGCEIVSLDEIRAHRCGLLLAKAGTADVVDASVVELAISERAEVITTDPIDLEALIAASGWYIPLSRR